MPNIIQGNNPQIAVENDKVGFLPLWKKEQHNPFIYYLLYEEDKTILAYLFYTKIYERMEIEQFKVLDTKQNQGIGTALLKELIRIAEKEKVENITLEVREDNQNAIHLYKKLGFQEVSQRTNYYQGKNGILMIKKYSF